MEALKNSKNPFAMLRGDANAVVLNGKLPFLSLPMCRDMNAGNEAVPAISKVRSPQDFEKVVVGGRYGQKRGAIRRA